MANHPKIFFFKENSWEPIVECDGNNLMYSVPVACGHFDKTLRFSISQEEFEVLKCDEERRYFLYAVLHCHYQSRPRAQAPQVDPHIQQVLFGTISEVEKLMCLRDAEHNGAVSNLVRVYMGRDQSAMRSGRWFK